MTTLANRMLAAKDSLTSFLASLDAGAFPGAASRLVTRDWKTLRNRDSEDLKRGVYTLISRGEGEFANYNGREAMDGKQSILMIFQIMISETDQGSLIEDAEGLAIEEVKNWCRALPELLGCLTLNEYTQSGQVEVPYGWVLFDLTLECADQ